MKSLIMALVLPLIFGQDSSAFIWERTQNTKVNPWTSKWKEQFFVYTNSRTVNC